MSPLTRTNEWDEHQRTLLCRHCGETIAIGTFAIVDLENRWFAIHESCLQDLGVDRSIQLYDEIAQLRRAYLEFAEPGSHGRLPVAETNRVLARLKELEVDVSNLRSMQEEKLSELPEWRRPGVRRQALRTGH